MDEEALKKAAEKERRRAQYAGKVFESKHPKQSQKEKSKDSKAHGGGGGGGANKANTKTITNENKESGSSISTSNSSSNSSNSSSSNSNSGVGGRRRGSINNNNNNDSQAHNNTALDNNTTAKSRLALFDHLDRKKPSFQSIEGFDVNKTHIHIHAVIVKLGLYYRSGKLVDDGERITALILAFYQVIKDYTTPPMSQLKRDLDKYIRNQVQHLVDSRHHSIGMGNFIKYLRHLVSELDNEISEAESKRLLLEYINTYLENRVFFARESIAIECDKIFRDGDTILTFGSSLVVMSVLTLLAKTKSIHVIVVDTRPLNSGFRTLQALAHLNIPCTYTPLSGAAALMRNVTRCLLGASALLSNGAMIAPAGTAMVCALAKVRQLPVIIASETYKFSEKVQLDSIVHNELGSPSELVKTNQENERIEPERNSRYKGAAGALCAKDPLPFQVINLRYDLTPIENISAVATEHGLIPPTSIPVLVEELRGEE